MFADDSKCFRVIKDASSYFVDINDDLNALLVWSTTNAIFFQTSKRLKLRTSRKRNSTDRWYNPVMRSQLEVVQTAKDLGVVITDDLKWSDQIFAVVAKANRMLGFLNQKTLYEELVYTAIFVKWMLKV